LKNKNILASVILVAESVQPEAVDLILKDIFKQTWAKIEVIVAYAKGADYEKLKDKWVTFPGNIFWLETDTGLDMLTKPIEKCLGDYIFYKTANSIKWYPRHIESHLDLLEYTNGKSLWSYSSVDTIDLSQPAPLNNLGWRIEFPSIEQFLLDELVHSNKIKVDWAKCIKIEGQNTLFVPGMILKQLKEFRFESPNEITLIYYVNNNKQKDVVLGVPISDVVKESVVDEGGQLVINQEFPTIVGNAAFKERNKSILNKITDNNKIKSIAIKRSMGLGDVILIEPALRALKEKYKNAKITLFTTTYASSNEAGKLFKCVDDIKIIDPAQLIADYLGTITGYNLKFDLDLAYESRPGIRYVDCYLDVCGFDEKLSEIDGKLVINRGFDNDYLVPQLQFQQEQFLKEKYVTMTIEGSGWGGKQWDVSKWKNIIKLLNNRGYKVVLTSGAYNINDFAGLNVTSNASNDFFLLLNLIKYTTAHFGSDSAPLHIATAFQKPTFIVSGAALTKYTTASNKVTSVYREDLECIGCKHKFFAGMNNNNLTFVPPCTNTDQFCCMTKLEESKVVEKLNEFLTQNNL